MDFILFLVLVKVNYNSYNNTVALRPDMSIPSSTNVWVWVGTIFFVWKGAHGSIFLLLYFGGANSA